MAAYLFRRLLLVIPTLFGIIAINFAVIQFAPGGPVEQMVAELKGRGGVTASMTGGGGDYADCFSGCGTVFELSPPASAESAWTKTILHTFTGGKDASSPAGGLVFGKNGVLFGVSLTGGVHGEGTVFGVVK